MKSRFLSSVRNNWVLLQRKILDQGSNFSHETRFGKAAGDLAIQGSFSVIFAYVITLLDFKTETPSKTTSSIRAKSRYRVKS